MIAGFGGASEQTAGEDVPAVAGQDAGGQPVPLPDHLGCRALMNQHRFGLPQQIAGDQALSGLDVGDFVEAHDGRPHCPPIGAVARSLLPAARFQVGFEQFFAVPVPGQAILEHVSPQDHRHVLSEDVMKIGKCQVRRRR